TGDGTHVHDLIRSDEVFALRCFVHICDVFTLVVDCVLFMLKTSDAGGVPTKFGHHGGVPWRVPDHFDSGCLHSYEVEQRLLRAPTDAFMHRAAGGGERHHHGHFLAGDRDVVNQTQVHDVTAQFRVNNLAQGFKDGLFGDFVGRHAVLGKVEIGRG